MQRVQHNLPLQFSQAPPATHYSGPDGFQHWSPLQLNDRSTASGFMYDPDSSSRYSGSTIPYMNSTNASVPTITAGSTAFPGLSPLVTHLPTHEMNRTLPNPSSIHSPYEGSDISNHDNDGDTVSFHQGLGKSRESWGLGRTIAGTSQGSVSSASQENVCASGPASSTSSSSPEESQDVATFGYMPLSQTTSNAPSTSPSDFRSMHPPLTARSLNNYGEASHSNRQGNHGLPCLNSPFDMYGVQGGVDDTHHDRSDSLSSGLAILNGQPRPRIIHPQPRPSPSYELLKGTFEGGASIPHRGLK